MTLVPRSGQGPNALDFHLSFYLGYVAAKRGDTNRARTQMAATEKKYANQRALVTINELGFYQRTQSILNGFGDI